MITAICTSRSCTTPSALRVEAKIDGLQIIPPSAYYTLHELNGGNVGDNGNHDGVNHFLLPDAADALEELAFQYAIQFADFSGTLPTPLAVNDASLPWGGLFDYEATWTDPHKGHRRGSVVDIRANGEFGSVPIDAETTNQFKLLAQSLGMKAQVHNPTKPTLRHFHVLLLNRNE